MFISVVAGVFVVVFLVLFFSFAENKTLPVSNNIIFNAGYALISLLIVDIFLNAIRARRFTLCAFDNAVQTALVVAILAG